MNVRRIVMVMLVLVFMVGGASAESWSISTSMGSGVYWYYNGMEPDDNRPVPSGYSQTVNVSAYNGQTGYYYSTVDMECYNGCTTAYSGSGLNGVAYITNSNPATGLQNYMRASGTYSMSNSGSFVFGASVITSSSSVTMAVNSYINMSHIRSSITVSTVPFGTASGGSCTGTGVYDVYTDWNYTYTDSDDGNYSFPIADGIPYQIHYTSGNISEWHNFTATASDETWNPSCPGTYTVSGTLLGPDGEGTNNALINLNNYTAFTSSTPANSGYSSATGSYSFENTEYGSYYISACGYGPCYPYTYDWFYVMDSDVIVANLTYPEKINIRFRVLDSNSTPQSGLYLHLQDAPSDYGGWVSTDTDGYTSYNPMYPSAIYVEIVDEDMTTLATTTITGNAQYEYQMSTITLPAPDANNTTIPVIPPDSDNSTPPSQPPAGGGDIGGGTVTDPGDYACTNTLTASVQDADHVAIVGASVKLYPYNSSISGSHSGTTDAAGEYTFPCTNATLSYNVEARATCYEHEISEDEGYSGTAYFHLNKTLTLACGFDDGSGGGGTGTNGTDSGDPDLIAEVTVSDDAMKAPILNYLFGGFLLVIFYMVATFYKKK